VKTVGAIVAMVGLVVAFVAAVWFMFALAFNVVVHELFGGPSITFWQAGGIVFLIGFVVQAIRGMWSKA
jgi:hypothetical protein